MVVPEERHLLRERRGRGHHLLEPPAAQLQPFAKLLLLEGLAVGFGCFLTAARVAQGAGR
jgi:hypothetical protein